jgi:serine protease Do
VIRRSLPSIAIGACVAASMFAACAAPGHGAAPSRSGDLPSSRRTAIVVAAERVSPAVVSVNVISTRVLRVDPFGGMFHDEFFDRFFPQEQYRQRVPSLGSGVIVDAAGTIVTNEHVVHDADEIKVTLSDGRQVPAEVLGSTPIYDLAVLRVRAGNLPIARLGDSDQLMVGEWAIAIGSPFGYLLNDTQPTVTAGVVSAIHRDVASRAASEGGGVYKDMIQTDAAINPGNSGGPLVNADGEVIGINSFIFTPSGGSIGLGFAIPINLVKKILTEIRTYGRVRQAYPGMTVQEVTRVMAQRLGFADEDGLVVTRVDDRGPAARAGVQVGDRIRKVDGQLVNSVDDAQKSIYGKGVGDRLRLQIDRGGKALELTLTLTEAPREDGR